MMETSTGVPSGMHPFLAHAHPTIEGDTVHLALPAPAAERLERGNQELRSLEGALATAMGRAIGVRIHTASPPVADGATTVGRVTRDTVRETRLRELIKQEPAIARAVEELDLELLE
jgi:hypothetical protein